MQNDGQASSGADFKLALANFPHDIKTRKPGHLTIEQKKLQRRAVLQVKRPRILAILCAHDGSIGYPTGYKMLQSKQNMRGTHCHGRLVITFLSTWRMMMLSSAAPPHECARALMRAPHSPTSTHPAGRA